MALFKNGVEVADDWTVVDKDLRPLPQRPLIVPLGRWLDERQTLLALSAPLGVTVEPGDDIAAIADDLDHLAVVRVNFPTFADGRGYSTARELRERYRFRGEIRACGDVLLDQIQFMRRCGIDVFEVTHEPTLRRLRAAKGNGVDLFYQPAVDGADTIAALRQRSHNSIRRLAS